jgi:head-tail adaptor
MKRCGAAITTSACALIRSARVDFRADIRAGNRVHLVAEDPPSGQLLNIMAIERDETSVGELRR